MAESRPSREVGYELNGNSLLCGNFIATPTVTKSGLPSCFLYVAGVNVAVTKRLTAAFDLYGQRVFGASQLEPRGAWTISGRQRFRLRRGDTRNRIPTSLVKSDTDISIVDASLGAKVRLFRHLLVTGNVLLKLNDSGLRAKVVPVGRHFLYLLRTQPEQGSIR